MPANDIYRNALDTDVDMELFDPVPQSMDMLSASVMREVQDALRAEQFERDGMFGFAETARPGFDLFDVANAIVPGDQRANQVHSLDGVQTPANDVSNLLGPPEPAVPGFLEEFSDPGFPEGDPSALAQAAGPVNEFDLSPVEGVFEGRRRDPISANLRDTVRRLIREA